MPARPFKLGTTSFIFPDHIVPNVIKLGEFFDEIEILAFESQPAEVLPSKEDVKKLLYLSRELGLTYNIHLPIDLSLTLDSKGKRQRAADTLLRVLDLFAPVKPSTHTLHLDMPPDMKNDIKNQKKLENWKDNTCQGLNALLSKGLDPGMISVETLDYPFFMIETLVEEFGLSVCIDAGHQIKYGHNILKTFEKHKPRTSIIHLHGVVFYGPKILDHTSLDKLAESHMGKVVKILKNFTGVVSLEVFNKENLNRSLNFLSQVFKDIAPNINDNRTKGKHQ
ncbi:MAG: sugar phosphate isomerase/epimerase [Deltaproteobacteria bacterium]|nr:sugar phosphate isomerase/epimerase [Deltaproteobacteria bacterium]